MANNKDVFAEDVPATSSQETPAPKDETGAAMAELAAKRERILEGKETAPGPAQEKRGRGRPPGSKGKKATDDTNIVNKIDETSIAAWQATTGVFTLVLAGFVEIFFAKRPLNTDERAAHTRAWAMYLSVSPPEDLQSYAKLQIAIVYAAIFAPRIGALVMERMKAKREAREKGLLEHPDTRESKKEEVLTIVSE